MATFEGEIVRALRNGSDLPFGAACRILKGRDREVDILRKDIQFVAAGGSALRVWVGDYGTGKSLLGRAALELGLEAGLLPIYVSEPPLSKPVELYQAIINGIITPEFAGDSLFYLLSQWAESAIREIEQTGLTRGQDTLFRESVTRKILDFEFTNDFNMAISAFVDAHLSGMEDQKKKIVDWMSGRKVNYWDLKALKISRRVETKEESYLFIQDILKLSRTIAYNGVLMVFDELELMQNLPSRTTFKGYEALREIVDMISSKDFPRLYSILLGTPTWFENPDRGVKSYLALYDRLKTEVSVTTESTVQTLALISPDIFDPLLSDLSAIYATAYGYDPKKALTATLKEALKTRLSSPFHQNQFVEMRQVVKSLIEFFDLLKDGASAEKALQIIDSSARPAKEAGTQTADFWG
ncbi:MAG TPA: DUF2791 family P-loop domain-containing protein [Thermotogota bacterium]|nr:DUF2791 family P-loop domain-containing protein [Thermotogota bacterium]HOF24387.1 DUF2791 family P-loop domain-containing protein [Thermotogota bacterium]HOM54005.1 DUF2791 family P-loop domain-containing protein [Thermotogota bacterium]HOS25621.1 DUF2791 family P-loop domain-containing protein [Thermotogota bacterium]HPD36383.1 DUF2791 family P-loop domain-containing protein [Thermotogota bacterium]